MSDDLEVYEEVRIRGHTVTVVEVKEKDKFSEDVLIRGIRRNNRITTPVLPAGTVMYSQDGNMQGILVWRPECELTIEFRGFDEPKDDDRKHFYEICFPCQVYGFKFQGSSLVNTHMWFAKGPIEHGETRLYTATVPNQSGSEMCLGDAYVKEVSGDILKTVSKIIRFILSSRYNHDLMGNLALAPPEFGDPARWSGNGGAVTDPRPFFQAWEDWRIGTSDWRTINDLGWRQAATVASALENLR